MKPLRHEVLNWTLAVVIQLSNRGQDEIRDRSDFNSGFLGDFVSG
jgi:hypothetical protein